MTAPTSHAGTEPRARVLGMETEYGIVGPPHLSCDALSRKVVRADLAVCAKAGFGADVEWDWAQETPLLDMRGHVDERPHELTRLNEVEAAFQRGSTQVRVNGARLYVDHAHPEYATAEVRSPLAAVIADCAGQVVLQRAAAYVRETEGLDVRIVKNNVDGKGSAYGCHENVLVPRAVPWEDLELLLLPFLVTRPAVCGTGRVGLGPASEEPGFQLSQRADYVRQQVALPTTRDRPIVNTRDEPHADPRKWRRLHVIGGDATCSPLMTLIKIGSLVAVTDVVAHSGLPARWRALALADPVAACRTVSRDLTLKTPLELVDGRRLTSLEIQRCYLDTARSMASEDVTYALEAWGQALDELDRDPTTAQVEWSAKLRVMEGIRAARGLNWGSPMLAAVDLKWGDLDGGIAAHLLASGHLPGLTNLPDFADRVEHATWHPPTDTRAYLRGQLVRRFPHAMHGASWHSIVLERNRERMLRIPVLDPFSWTEEQIGPLFAATSDIETVISHLTGAS